MCAKKTDRKAYSREALIRISDRKKRRLAIDDSNEMTTDNGENSDIAQSSLTEVVEESPSPMKGHRDLFGEFVPHDVYYNNPTPKTNSHKKKTPASRKKKQPIEKNTIDVRPILRPKRVFIPTPKIAKIMKEAQTELYSLMGHSKSLSDISIISNDTSVNLNVSGVDSLIDSPIIKTQNSKTNNKQVSLVLEGVAAFIDYKVDNDRSGTCIIPSLIELGAKIEKSFNSRVTHVVFRNGYRKTYNKALEHNIPLVSLRWIEGCKLANKLLDPSVYPPVGLEKYEKKQNIDFKIPKKLNKHEKIIRPSDFERDVMLKTKCDDLMKRVNALESCHDENDENHCINTTPQKRKTVKEPEDLFETDDIISVLSDQLNKVLNMYDSPWFDAEVNELYIPMSIKLLRKYLTPKDKDIKTPAELNSDIAKIEDRLNLNSQARQRLRKLLFPSDKNVNDISVISDFPTPSPPKCRISAPARLTSTKKQKKLLDQENVKVISNNLNENKVQDSNVENTNFRWQIPSDLRPKKFKKFKNQKPKSVLSETQDTMLSTLSRGSSIFFQTPKNSFAVPVPLPTITCTGMKKSELNIIKQSIQNLGQFVYQTTVEQSTTFLVTKTHPCRTLNLVFAMAFGCYIISENWVHESHRIGRWLSHEQYLISDLSEPVKAFQIRRNTFGSLLTFHIFDNAGKIYISNTCEPSAKNLKRLVRVCGGHCTNNEIVAEIVVGRTLQMNNNIHEKWIFDCITQGTLLNTNQYLIH